MSRTIALIGMACLALTTAVLGAEAKKEHLFVGVGKCYTCHKGEKKGSQFETWMKSDHFKAYDTLATDKAKATAKERGIEGDPQKAEACLKCHSLKLGIAEGKIDAKASFAYKIEEDGKKVEKESLTIQCENCHGPGSDYKTSKVMKSHDESVANGMWLAKERCVTCHDEKNDPDFNLEEDFKKIAHPVPAERKAENKAELEAAGQ
jgi:nitrate reductase cytochrome c-type subunit